MELFKYRSCFPSNKICNHCQKVFLPHPFTRCMLHTISILVHQKLNFPILAIENFSRLVSSKIIFQAFRLLPLKLPQTNAVKNSRLDFSQLSLHFNFASIRFDMFFRRKKVGVKVFVPSRFLLLAMLTEKTNNKLLISENV